MSEVVKRNILLNPGPVTTTDSVKQALLVADICHREQEFTDLLQTIRRDLLKVVQAGDDYTSVLFCASGTGALDACINSVVKANEKIAIVNNGSYGQRLIDIAKRYQLNVVEIQSPVDQPLSLDVIESKLSQDPDIRYLALVHHETSSGLINPLHEVGQITQRLQRSLIVDAMSSLGGYDIDVNRDHIDFIISSSNKCLHGMPGLSFVIANKEKLLATENNARSYYLDLYKQYHSLETNGQMAFTPPVQVAYAFKQALDEYFAEGGAVARMQRYQHNYQRLMSGLKDMGFAAVLPESCQSHILVTVRFPDDGCSYDFDQAHDYLYQRGYTIYPRKLAFDNTFRLACIGDLNATDIDGFLAQLQTYTQSVCC